MASKKELEALITLAGKVDPSLKRALQQVESDSRKTQSQLSQMASTSNKLVSGLVKTGLAAGAAIGSGLVYVGKKGLDLASDLKEVQNVVDTTFEGSTSQINTWAKSALENFGLGELQAKQFTGTMGAMLKSSGLTGDAIVRMSEDLSGLAGDFASFYNLENEEAFAKIRAGVSGETEPLKQLGINMSVANLEAFAMANGIKTAYSEMDQASQTALRYKYLMDVSKDAQGDYVKTQGEFANQTRLLNTNLGELAATVMSEILPVVTEYIQKANEFISGIANDPEKMKKLQDAVASIAEKIGDVASAAYDVYIFIKDNWPAIEPIVWGVVAAMTAFVVVTKAALVIQTLTKAWHMASKAILLYQSGMTLATAIQMAFNGTALANPLVWIIGGIVLAVGGLVAAIIWLRNNWDKVTETAAYVLGTIKDTWSTVGTWFYENVVKPVANFFIGMQNGINSGLNVLIRGLNKINIKVPDWVPEIGGKQYGIKIPEIPSVPYYAKGGFANQPSIFGEAGPEAAIPIKYKDPRSLSLLSQTAKAIGAGSGSSVPSLMFSFNFSGPVYSKEDVLKGVEASEDRIREIIEKYFFERERVNFG